MASKRLSQRILNLEARTAINEQSKEIAAQAIAIGASGQAGMIGALRPLEAGHAAIRCFLARLGSHDPETALMFADTLREHACAQRVSEQVQS